MLEIHDDISQLEMLQVRSDDYHHPEECRERRERGGLRAAGRRIQGLLGVRQQQPRSNSAGDAKGSGVLSCRKVSRQKNVVFAAKSVEGMQVVRRPQC